MTEKSNKNWFKRHKILTVVLAFLAISIISGAASGGEKPADSSSNKSSTSTAQKSETAAEEEAAPPEPKVYQGTGDDVLDIQKPGDGPAIVTFECPACADNAIVKTNGAESLLVNTGSHLIDTSSGSNTTQVTVTVSGAWKVTVSGLDKATPVNGQPVSRSAGQPVSRSAGQPVSRSAGQRPRRQCSACYREDHQGHAHQHGRRQLHRQRLSRERQLCRSRS